MRFIPVESPEGWYVQIEATGVGSNVVDDLLSSKGSFEAKISKPVDLRDGRGSLVLGASTYQVEISNESARVGDILLPLNRTFTLEGIEFQLLNVTSSKAVFMATVYKGDDIEIIYTDPQHSGLVPSGNAYRFYFTILVSKDGADRFAKVTSGIPSQLDLESGDSYLKDTSIFLYLDNKLQSSLRIASTLGGQAYSTPQIDGAQPTLQEASDEKIKLQTILRSGALPVSLETESISIISPTLGSNFIESALIAALLAGVAVVVVIFIRYRNLKVAIPMALTGFSEIIIILGISASGPADTAIWSAILALNVALIFATWWKLKESDISAWLGAIIIPVMGLLSWSIDLPAIGGIIAAIGTGVDQMIIIADETISGRTVAKKLYSIKERIGRAFSIIFASAAVTISALVPLLFVTAGVFVRGFVITTVAGIFIGVLITRPAYAKIVEMTVGRQHHES
jgi:preprotein translocase subunit SecD